MKKARGTGLEQFQQKCEAVLRPELRKNKEIERFRDSEKDGNALGLAPRAFRNDRESRSGGAVLRRHSRTKLLNP